MLYFSPEYFEELARRLNTDADWSKIAASLTVKLTLTLTDRATSHMLEVA